MIHQVSKPGPDLRHLLFDLEQSERSNGAVVVMGILEVGELNLKISRINIILCDSQ